MPGYHSPRSPSSAHRWRRCPAAIRECEGLPDEVGEEAHQGTVFHEFAAMCVEFGIDGWGMVGARLLCEDGKHREFTQEMATKMLPGLDLLQALSNDPAAILMVENWVDTSPWVGPGEGGTSDAFIINIPKKRLTIFDWKWGAGVVVLPEWNDQGIIYALGVWNTFAREIFEAEGISAAEVTVQIIIEQPRAPGGGGVWEVPLISLLAEGRKIRKDAESTRDPDAPFVPGVKQCQFCPAAAMNICEARTDWILDMLGDDVDPEDAGARIETYDSLELRERRALTPEQRSLIVLNTKAITNWLTQLYEEAMDDATKGRPVPGMKRVAGRAGRRKWVDEKKAEIIVVDEVGAEEAYKKTLLSPAQVEDEVGKTEYRSRFAALVVQAEGKPALVPEDDPKPALASAVDMLDDAWDETAETAETAETENLI